MSAEEKFAKVFSENSKAKEELLDILNKSADTGVLSDDQVEAIVACAARYDIDITEGELNEDALDEVSGGVHIGINDMPIKVQLINMLSQQGLLAGLNTADKNNQKKR